MTAARPPALPAREEGMPIVTEAGDEARPTSLPTTSSQTVGPYLHIGLTWLVVDDLVGAGVTGEPITIEGRISDADGAPVDDALVEIWQANAHGRYDHPDDTRALPLEAGFKGFGRVPTDARGGFRFTTIKPGAVPAADLSAAGPPQGANGAPSGGSEAATAASVGGRSSAAGPPQGANGAPSGGSEAATAATVGAVPMQAPHINVTIFMRGMLRQLSTRIYFPGDPANGTDPVLARVPAQRRDTLIARPAGAGVLQWNVVLRGDGETVFFEY